MQLRWQTDLTAEEYVTRRAWQEAIAPECAWCRRGTCRLRPHGTYERVWPPGAQVRRFLCRRRGATVSLLPDCLAAQVKGSLEQIEEAVRAAEQAGSREQAVEQLRPPGECGLAGGLRWLRWRVQWVRALLVVVKGLCPEPLAGVEPTLEAFGAVLGSDVVLRRLRQVARAHLQHVPAPVGFRCGRRHKAGQMGRGARTQYTGLSPPAGSA